MPVPSKTNYFYDMVIYGVSSVAYKSGTLCTTKAFKTRTIIRFIITRKLRKLHNEELNDLYCSSYIIRVIKSRMRRVGHVARMGQGRSV